MNSSVCNFFSGDRNMDAHRCNPKREITVLGTGCSGAVIIFRASKKYHVEVYEAGVYRIDDGATYNLALPAPAVHSSLANVAALKPAFTEPLPAPAGPPLGPQWVSLTYSPVWNSTTTPTYPSFIPVALRQNQSQASIFGGSFEHIQGLRVNPSPLRCKRWSRVLEDDRFSTKSIFATIIEDENFRMTTIPTSQTWDGSAFAPFSGPSALGSTPIHRGYNGVLQVSQSTPSLYAINLAQAMYDYYHNVKGNSSFTNQPIVATGRESTTFNSGINACITRATETYIDITRTRVTTARNFLNRSVIEPTVPHQPSGNPGFTINPGPFRGINGHDILMYFGQTVTRIIFDTKCRHYKEGQYWTPNFSADRVKAKKFRWPLRAIGISTTTEAFIPIKDTLVVSLGAYATPVLMMLSGIGPKDVLQSLGIPVLLDQPNMGKHIGNHYGCLVRWNGNATKWGGQASGTQNTHGYLGISEAPKVRKFQFYSAVITPGQTWQLNLYNLTPISTGSLVPTLGLNGKLLGVKVDTNYFDLQVDRDNLCEVARDVAKAIILWDPTATFVFPALPYPFPEDNNVLFLALMQQFTQQAHYVGSCGMGPDEKYHCVDSDFLLRGTENVYVCDAASTPLEVDKDGNTFPLQNDGNTTGALIPFAEIFSQQLLDDY